MGSELTMWGDKSQTQPGVVGETRFEILSPSGREATPLQEVGVTDVQEQDQGPSTPSAAAKLPHREL